MTQTAEIQCGDDAFAGLVALFNAVVFRKFPEATIEPDDMEEMVDMLQTLRPGLRELAMLRGMVAVTRKDWQGASAIFTDLRDRGLCSPSSDAMAVFCMGLLGDADWRAAADALLAGQRVTDSHRLLVQALVARQDLERAAREASVKGVYDEPDSVRELIEQNQRTQEAALTDMGAAASAPAATIAPAGAYLRV
ncbi:Type III secretion protein, HrpB1 [plant metagenome]|uniref:Type III secretion protein, HrpB1 n=1 Tax=plant metagenome TaxID=1297885 RepID=A0A484RV76_9ZZZZ